MSCTFQHELALQNKLNLKSEYLSIDTWYRTQQQTSQNSTRITIYLYLLRTKVLENKIQITLIVILSAICYFSSSFLKLLNIIVIKWLWEWSWKKNVFLLIFGILECLIQQTQIYDCFRRVCYWNDSFIYMPCCFRLQNNNFHLVYFSIVLYPV